MQIIPILINKKLIILYYLLDINKMLIYNSINKLLVMEVINIRDWLIESRLKYNKNQNELAKACNITNSYYCMIEKGKRNPSIKIAKLIAKELNFKWTIFFAN